MPASIPTSKGSFFGLEALRSKLQRFLSLMCIAEERKQLLPLSRNLSCHSTPSMFIRTSEGAAELPFFLYFFPPQSDWY